MTGDERYGYLPVGKSTALQEPCQEFGQGSLGVERKRDKGQGDKGTRGQGDKGKGRGFSLSPPLLVPLSPCPSVPLSLFPLFLCRNYGLLSSAGVSRNSTGSWQHSQGPGLYAVI